MTVSAVGCGFDSHSRKWNVCLNLYFDFYSVSRQNAALSYATEHAIPPEFDGKCLNASVSFVSLCLYCCGQDTGRSCFSISLINFSSFKDFGYENIMAMYKK